jgi:predicted ATPase
VANVDAMAHIQQGLAALSRLPDSPERLRHELTLQTMLGAAVIYTSRFNAPEVVRAFARARELSEQVGDMPQLFTVLRGLWSFYLMRSDLTTASKLADHLLRLAQRHTDPELFLEAHRAVATSRFFLGEQTAVMPHLERGLELSEVRRRAVLTFRHGQDTAVMFLLYKSFNLWIRGYPDQALQNLQRMMRLSRQHTDVYSRSHASTVGLFLYQWRRETHFIHEQLKVCLALADQLGVPFLMSLCTVFQGWVQTQQGRFDQGITQIRRGIADYRATGLGVVCTCMLALLAEAHQQAGHIAEGLRTVLEALDLVDQHGERWWEAELHRLQAEFLLQGTTPDVARAETVLHHAIAVARSQQAKSLELRSTMSLCRLWQQQGKHRQAQKTLRDIYAWFTEGHDTADLQEAKALLDTM